MKRKNIKAICLGIAMAVAIPVAAQNKVVQGTVYDELGEPVIGATVIVKGTKYATVTDFNGQYKLEVPKDAKVTVSYVGYVPQVTTGGRISLQEDRNSLEEIVVVGYGTQSRVSLTGAVAKKKTNIETLSARKASLQARLQSLNAL